MKSDEKKLKPSESSFRSMISLALTAFVLACLVGIARELAHKILSISDNHDLIFNIAWLFVIIISFELYSWFENLIKKRKKDEI